MTISERDKQLAEKATRNGARYALTIIQEARRANILVSLALALVEQESGFVNTFGHDRGKPFEGAGNVTRPKVQAYLKVRGPKGKGGMQGVGVTQLTWWEFQDRAEKLGGLHWPRYQCRVGFELLAALEAQHGLLKGLAIYNGGAGSPNFVYAAQVRARMSKWHDLLT